MRNPVTELFTGFVALSMFVACGDDTGTSGDTTSGAAVSGATSTAATGAGGGAACQPCLQMAALGQTCLAKTQACLADHAGGAGGACSSCQDWTVICQTKSIEECAAAQADLCASAQPLAADSQSCTCGVCANVCTTQCTPSTSASTGAG